MRKINVVTVEYLNTKPFLEGLKRSNIYDAIELDIAHPSLCAQKITSHQGEIGLIPVAALPFLEQYEIITDYCLGCDGAVSSVCIYSEIPIEECEYLILDYQSRSSVALTKYLEDKHWQYGFDLIQGEPGYEENIRGNYAGLVIGDRCFTLKDRYQYTVDLGHEWKQITGLPFVFAVWITKIGLADEFKEAFNQALANGVGHLEWSVPKDSPAWNYLAHNISYDFNEDKKKAFKLFMKYLEEEMVTTAE